MAKKDPVSWAERTCLLKRTNAFIVKKLSSFSYAETNWSWNERYLQLCCRNNIWDQIGNEKLILLPRLDENGQNIFHWKELSKPVRFPRTEIFQPSCSWLPPSGSFPASGQACPSETWSEQTKFWCKTSAKRNIKNQIIKAQIYTSNNKLVFVRRLVTQTKFYLQNV